jgi:hypothetical protein
VFCKSLLVICSFSFSIVSTFRDCVFSCSDISFCAKQKSDYIFDMKYPYFVSQDYQTFLYILRVRWLFPNQTFITQNAFQILLTGEVTKSSIFYADVVIVYINPGGCHHDRDGMVVEFTTTCTISALALPTLCFRIPFMVRCIR